MGQRKVWALIWNRGHKYLCTLFRKLKKISCRTYLLFYYSCLVKKIAFKSSVDLYLHPLAVFFWFVLRETRSILIETMVSGKVVPVDFNLKFISKFNHVHKTRDEIFEILKPFKIITQFTWAAYWINSKVSRRYINITIMTSLCCHVVTIIGHYHDVIIQVL